MPPLLRREGKQSLWTSVKIAKDEETNEIPPTMHLGVNQYKGQDIPEAFADHFNDK